MSKLVRSVGRALDLPKQALALTWLVGLSLFTIPLTRLASLTGASDDTSRTWAYFVCLVIFLGVHVVPRELDPSIIGLLGGKAAAGVCAIKRRVQGNTRTRIVIGAIVAGLVLTAMGSLLLRIPESQPWLLVAFAITALISGILARAVLVEYDLAILSPREVYYPVAALLTLGGVSVLVGVLATRGAWFTSAGVSLGCWVLVFVGLRSTIERGFISVQAGRLNSEDALWDVVKPFSMTRRRSKVKQSDPRAQFMSLLAEGRLRDAEALLDRLLRHEVLKPKEMTKCRARLLFRLRRYHQVLALIESYDRNGGKQSAVLVSLKALCLLYVGRTQEAHSTLERATGTWGRSNPYLRLNLGHCEWFRGDAAKAAKTAHAAGEIYSRRMRARGKPGQKCGLALNNEAYYILWNLMRECAQGNKPGNLEERLAKALELVTRSLGVLRNEREKALAYDTMGLILALRGKVADAGHLLQVSLGLLPSPATRNHLGLLYMIGSDHLFRCRAFFEGVMRELEEIPEHPDYLLASENLRRVEIAEREGWRFSPEIVLYSLTRVDHTPAAARVLRESVHSEAAPLTGVYLAGREFGARTVRRAVNVMHGSWWEPFDVEKAGCAGLSETVVTGERTHISGRVGSLTKENRD